MVSKHQRIIDTYNVCKSVRETSRVCGCSECVVVKVLITYGIYSNKSSERVSELVSIGKSADEICDIIGLSKSCVNKYIPYTKGTYLTDESEKSANALRIKKCRNK